MDSDQTYKIVSDWYGAMGQFNWDYVVDGLDENVVFILDPKPYTKMIPYLGVWEGKAAFMEAANIRNTTSQITGFGLKDLVAQGNKAVALIYSAATCIATQKPFELDEEQIRE